MIKIAAVADPVFLDRIEDELELILTENDEKLVGAVFRSCELKAEVVQADERESGRREILNSGHTLGHAVESSGVEPAWLHGEAISLGMIAALRIGARAGLGQPEMRERMETLLERAALPRFLPEKSDLTRILGLMEHDKKRRAGKVRWVLLENWGRPHWGRDVAPGDLAAILEELRT